MIKDLIPGETNHKYNPKWQFLALYLILASIICFLIIKLIDLQIVKGGENAYLSSITKTSESTVRAPRGIIYDRNNNPLVINKPSYRIGINPQKLSSEESIVVLEKLATIIGEDKEVITEEYNNQVINTENGIIPEEITITRDASRDQILSIYSNLESFPGVFVELDAKREYIYPELLAHILGYVGEVTVEDLEMGDYTIGDIIGKSGLENYYDSTLRGVNGKKFTQLNVNREETKELDEVAAKEGNNLYISIDIEAQQKMTDILKAKMEKYNSPGAAAVIEDVNTGEIIVLVSLPSFDSNKLVKGLTYKEFQELYNNPNLPLYNRAITGAYAPGSTHKTIVATAALQENAIDETFTVESRGCMDLGGGFEFCEAGKRSLGILNLTRGIALSSNIFFCESGLKLGIDKMAEYDREYGLGALSGIDLPQESSGTIASREYKMELFGEQWYPGDTCNAAIGQGATTTTPIQMTNWIAAIANGGKLLEPHIAVKTTDLNNNLIEEFSSKVKNELPIEDQHLAKVREGMHEVVNDPWGSAWILRGLPLDPCAKTGSAEAYRKVGNEYQIQAHAWVTGFFPYENPQYSFTVFLEYGGWGYESAEAINEFLDWYAKRETGN